MIDLYASLLNSKLFMYVCMYVCMWAHAANLHVVGLTMLPLHHRGLILCGVAVAWPIWSKFNAYNWLLSILWPGEWTCLVGSGGLE